ncbi:MAG: class I SAM-dependent methyltransferase [Dehalococcoidia bacterium]|nr:class I SAM-dependent methyltransferase [Dehalococcoidia bacterium]
MVHQVEARPAAGASSQAGAEASAAPPCASCGAALTVLVADLGMQPPCEAFPQPSHFAPEAVYPLRAYVCARCFLVQAPSALQPEEIFTDYAYFSSYSDSWLAHCRTYAEMVRDRFALTSDSSVIELASNDGYLLRNFVEFGIPCLGIEPAENVAEVAQAAGVPTLAEFFGVSLAERLAGEGAQADLVIGNNVLAQCPVVHDFVGGIPRILKAEGVLTLEFPHLVRLMEGLQYDTIYHEHFFYFSLLTVEDILGRHGLRVFDVEQLPTHGGSLRIFACHDAGSHPETQRLRDLRADEAAAGIDRIETYTRFQARVVASKFQVLEFLIAAKREGKRIAAYGAPGKGNTLLNYCGLRQDFFDYAVDRNPWKHGRVTPVTQIPIHPPERLRETQPDLVVVMPWNLKDEIASQHAYIEEWGGRFVTFLPEVRLLEGGEWRPA